MYDDTIAAIATPQGEGGIGTVRISGAAAEAILTRIFMTARGKSLQVGQAESHKLIFGTICDPRTGAKLDEALVALMRGPHSYTREDIVEIDCHGGTVALQSVLSQCLREGARLAEPGEFTLRAFLNGRLDLAQAEAVLDVVQARTSTGLSIAANQLGGSLSAQVKKVRADLLLALAFLEANIDFPEDDVPTADVTPELESALQSIMALIDSAGAGIVMRQGVKTALVGRPNVGKSSLLNALLRTERAIVTPVPGTTRDTLEEVANVRGVPLVLTDTAGLRDANTTHDPIEHIGMERTRRAIEQSSLIVLVFDGSEPLSSVDIEVIEQAREISPAMMLAVVNKSDLPPALNIAELQRHMGSGDIVEASATTPDGTNTLEERLASLILSGQATPQTSDAVVSSVRHRDALQRAGKHVEEAIASANNGIAAAFVAVDLHSALAALGEITGESVGEDLLDEIFSKFCIGK